MGGVGLGNGEIFSGMSLIFIFDAEIRFLAQKRNLISGREFDLDLFPILRHS